MGRVFGILLFSIIIGPIIGGLGRLIIPGKQSIGFGKTIGVGILAAFLGGIVAMIFDVDKTKGIDWIQWGLQIGFAAVGVALVAGMGGRKPSA